MRTRRSDGPGYMRVAGIMRTAARTLRRPHAQPGSPLPCGWASPACWAHNDPVDLLPFDVNLHLERALVACDSEDADAEVVLFAGVAFVDGLARARIGTNALEERDGLVDSRRDD